MYQIPMNYVAGKPGDIVTQINSCVPPGQLMVTDEVVGYAEDTTPNERVVTFKDLDDRVFALIYYFYRPDRFGTRMQVWLNPNF